MEFRSGTLAQKRQDWTGGASGGGPRNNDGGKGLKGGAPRSRHGSADSLSESIQCGRWAIRGLPVTRAATEEEEVKTRPNFRKVREVNDVPGRGQSKWKGSVSFGAARKVQQRHPQEGEVRSTWLQALGGPYLTLTFAVSPLGAG